MSPEKIVRDFYARFGAGDIEGALALLAEDVIWSLHGPVEIPYFGVFEGRDGVRDFFARLAAAEDIRAFNPNLFHASANIVCVEGDEVGVAKETGRAFSARWVQVFKVNGGLIAAWDEYIDTYPLVMAYRR